MYAESQKTPSSQSHLEQKIDARGITIPDLKIYNSAIVIKNNMVWEQK